MVKLNVQINDDLFELVERYARKYRITRAAAVSCLLTFAFDSLMSEIEIIQRDRSLSKRGMG